MKHIFYLYALLLVGILASLLGCDSTNPVDGTTPQPSDSVLADSVDVIMWSGPSNAAILGNQGDSLFKSIYHDITGRRLEILITSSAGSSLLAYGGPTWWSPEEGGTLTNQLFRRYRSRLDYAYLHYPDTHVRVIGIIWHNGIDQHALYEYQTRSEDDYRNALYQMLTDWQSAASSQGYSIHAFLVESGTDPTVDPSIQDTLETRFKPLEREVFNTHPIGVVATVGTTAYALEQYQSCLTQDCRNQWFQESAPVHWGPSSVDYIITEAATTIAEFERDNR